MIHYKVKSVGVRRTLNLRWAAYDAFFSTWIWYWGWGRRPGLLLRSENDSLISSVWTQKNLLSDVITLLRMIGCLRIRFVQTSRRTFKTLVVRFLYYWWFKCLLWIIWIIVYSSDVLVYSWINLEFSNLYYTSVNNLRCSYICSYISDAMNDLFSIKDEF